MKCIFTICALISSLCAVRMVFGQAASPSQYADAEAYAVYSVLIKEEWPARVAKADKLVIWAETSDYPSLGDGPTMCLLPAKGEEAIYGPVVANYQEVNKKVWSLQPKFDMAAPYQIVPGAVIDEIFAKKGIDGWKEFYAKYPGSGGAISMSAVGFNADRTIALVYMGHSCGGLCGGGSYHVLQKNNGKWAEIEWHGMQCMWAS